MLKLAIDGGQPVRQTLLPYSRQTITEDDIAAVVATLRSDWLTTGPKVLEFENALAKFSRNTYAVAVSNGTAALHCALFAAGIDAESEVITTPLTFVATANAVRYLGGTVKFADICPQTYNIDPDSIAALITPKTKAILTVDFAGQPCDYRRINAIAKRHNLITIADAAHALGGAWHGAPVGSLADLTTFSLHPVKPITTGEGGAIITHDAQLAERMRLFRSHGIATDHKQRETLGTWHYDMQTLGFNYRLSDIQCALGLTQLEQLTAWTAKRQAIAEQYQQAFHANPAIITPYVHPDAQSAWHLYVVQLDLTQLSVPRDQIYRALRAENIGVNVHYQPVPWHSYYQQLGYQKGQWPVAEKLFSTFLSLPLWPSMSATDIQDVIRAVNKVLAGYTFKEVPAVEQLP